MALVAEAHTLHRYLKMVEMYPFLTGRWQWKILVLFALAITLHEGCRDSAFHSIQIDPLEAHLYLPHSLPLAGFLCNIASAAAFSSCCNNNSAQMARRMNLQLAVVDSYVALSKLSIQNLFSYSNAYRFSLGTRWADLEQGILFSQVTQHQETIARYSNLFGAVPSFSGLESSLSEQ